MTSTILLGECTTCARRIYNRPDQVETEWVRIAGGELRPHRHRREHLGTCTLCGYRVYRGGDGVERVLVGKHPRPHGHRRKAFDIVPEPAYRIVPLHETARAGAA